MAPQGEQLEFAVVADEIVHIVILEPLALGDPEKEDGGQGLVEVQSEDLAKG